MKRNVLWVPLLSLTLATSAFAKKSEVESFAVDTDHSGINFKIRHLIGKVSGNFDTFEGKVEFDSSKPSKLKTWGKIDAASIDTGIEKRDEHLRSQDFFDVKNEKNPEYKWITFESDKLRDVTESGNELKGKLDGKITIRGVTKPITLDATIQKPILDPWGNERIAISANGILNREDFGLNWNKPWNNALQKVGDTTVGENVELNLEVSAFRKATESKDEKKAEKKSS